VLRVEDEPTGAKVEGLLSRAYKLTVRTANLYRSLGEKLQMACNRERMTLGFYLGVKDRLPPSLTFERCKACISVFRRFPEPITDAWTARRVVDEISQ